MVAVWFIKNLSFGTRRSERKGKLTEGRVEGSSEAA